MATKKLSMGEENELLREILGILYLLSFEQKFSKAEFKSLNDMLENKLETLDSNGGSIIMPKDKNGKRYKVPKED